MRISVIVPSFYPAGYYGGTIFSIHESLKLLSSRNIKIYVSTTSANGDKRLNVKKNKFIKFKKNYYVKYYFDEIINRFSFSFLFGIWNDIKKSDIVYVQDIFSIFAVVAFIASNFYKKKCLIAPRGSLSEYGLRNKFYFVKKMWIYLFFKLLNNNYSWHITSDLEKKEILNLGLKGKKYTIPNYIKFNLTKINAIKPLNWLNKNSKKIKIGTLTRIDKKKGLKKLIKAFSIILKDTNAHLAICGEDHGVKNDLIFLVKKMGLQKNVSFLKPMYGLKKYQFLKSLDVFCLPSENENFGNVYLESLRVGTPIVASKFTPWHKIKVYKCGLITNNKIPNIANNIKMIISNRKFFNKRNCQNLANVFSESYIINSYLVMFNELN